MVLLHLIVVLQLRDVRAVGKKFFHVLYPVEKKSLLKECKYTYLSLVTVKIINKLFFIPPP